METRLGAVSEQIQHSVGFQKAITVFFPEGKHVFHVQCSCFSKQEEHWRNVSKERISHFEREKNWFLSDKKNN